MLPARVEKKTGLPYWVFERCVKKSLDNTNAAKLLDIGRTTYKNWKLLYTSKNAKP